MSPQAFLLQTRGIFMKLEVYKPEEILVNLVIRYDEIVDAFASVPKFIQHGEDLFIAARFNPRTGDLLIEKINAVLNDDGIGVTNFNNCDSFSRSRDLNIAGDIQQTFLQPFASRMAEGVRLALIARANRANC